MPKKSLLIISLHSGSWKGFSPWIERDEMPALSTLLELGYSRELQALLPTFRNPNS